MSLNFSNYTGNVQDFYMFYFYFYVHPILTCLSFVANTVCAIVFAQRELLSSGPVFHYSLAQSVVAAIGMLIATGLFISRCGPQCRYAYSYESQVYELYGVMFVCNSLFFASSLIQIAISSHIYLCITQKVFKEVFRFRFKRVEKASPVKVILVIVVVALVFGLVVMSSFEISPRHYVTIVVENTKNGTSVVYRWTTLYQILLDPNKPVLVYTTVFVQIVSNKLFLIVLIVINCLLYFELRKTMSKKRELYRRGSESLRTNEVATTIENNNADNNQNNYSLVNLIAESRRAKDDASEESRRMTLVMVLWVSVVFSSSRFTAALANLVLLLMQNTVYNWYASTFNIFYGSLVYISCFFVYLNTNKIFRKKFYEIFLRKRIVHN